MAPPFVLLAAAAAARSAVGGLHWASWDGAQVCQPRDFFQPSGDQELAAYVAAAARRNETVKVVGAGHSFSAAAMADDGGHVVSLDRVAGLIRVERHARGNVSRVTVGAGIRLHSLNPLLEGLGLALPNLGATAEQSLAGAAATGTHGTGRTGSISAAVSGLRIVTADGRVVDTSAEAEAELFAAARVGVGAVGIVTAVTLDVVDLFRMRYTATPYRLDDLLPQLPALLRQHDRLQWFWTPYTQNATVVIRTPTTDPVTGCWHGSSSPGPSGCVDVSYKTMTGSEEHHAARPLYSEMEMFVPAALAADAVRDFLAFQESVRAQHDPAVSLFTGVRYVDADDIPLSPQYHRDNAVISMIVLGDAGRTGDPAEFRRYTEGLESVCMGKYQGRPHWGKQNYASAADIAAAYPDTIHAFRATRERWDPAGVFLNDYLRQRILP